MMASIRRRLVTEDTGLPTSLHPLLRRLYAARGVRAGNELELGLDQLIPVRQL
jgi:single-stranded-DNA-specific exonuclease